MSNAKLIQKFFVDLDYHTKIKTKLYDGSGKEDYTIDGCIRLITEELGELSSAATRERFMLAKSECLDIAHCALLAYLATSRKIDELSKV